MAHVYQRTDSGLLVAEQAAGFEPVAAALRGYDRDLRLVPMGVDPVHQKMRWGAYRYMGPDRLALFVCAWQTRDGEPLPLSMGLLSMVQEQDRNSRAPRVDEDELNRRLVEGRRRESTVIAEEVARDMEPRMRPGYSAVLHRGQGLRRARDRARARGENV